MLRSDSLVRLISSMTKGEKRNFKLISQKTGGNEKLYVRLFDHIEKYQEYNERKILQKIPAIRKSQMSNLKAVLAKQLLRALRDVNKEEYPEIKARERFDFAKVLYAKGQYRESLEMLQVVKKMAADIDLKPLEYMALSFEKQIESQHVTKSMSPKAYELVKNSEEILTHLHLTNELANLSLLLYARYLERGLVKNEQEYLELNKYFYSIMPIFELESLDFYQKLNLYQSYVWFYHMSQDFLNYFKYSNKWVHLFYEFPNMKIPATVLYLKGLHNVLNALFMANKPRQFNAALTELNEFNSDKSYRLSENEKTQLELFRSVHTVNQIFLNANYDEAITIIQPIEQKIRNQEFPWDQSRIMTFHYKIACVHFGMGDLDSTITYLNKVENLYQPRLKVDIQCFSRVLNLISHYELGNEILVSYRIKSVYRFLLKMEALEKVQTEIFRFIRRTPKMSRNTILDEFKGLKASLELIESQRFEKRPFLYLDIISWLDSKIDNISMADAIRKRKKLSN